jgi:hypothetical protein
MKKVAIHIFAALFILLIVMPGSAHASDGQNISYIVRGASRIFGSVFAIPKAMIQDSQRIMFPFGIVTGAVRGTVGMVGGLLGGTMDTARGAAPYAKYAALAL